jgi:RNA polymerase sigma-70 factor (ECF subfamily)
MDGHEWLAQRFQENRPHLMGVAYRMLGSASEADDAVQEAWLRLNRSDTDQIENLIGWLTTVVGRVCLDMLRARRVRSEVFFEVPETAPALPPMDDGVAPEQEALLADSVGLALLVVLETLAPAERLAFVLHDLFGVPFDEIATVVDRTPAAARQLASRARRRVRGGRSMPDPDVRNQRLVVEAFLTAARGGDMDALIAVLAPDVVARSDEGVGTEVRGAFAVAKGASTFAQIAGTAELVLINGTPGVIAGQEGKRLRAMTFEFSDHRISGIDVITDPGHLRDLHLAVFDD